MKSWDGDNSNIEHRLFIDLLGRRTNIAKLSLCASVCTGKGRTGGETKKGFAVPVIVVAVTVIVVLVIPLPVVPTRGHGSHLTTTVAIKWWLRCVKFSAPLKVRSLFYFSLSFAVGHCTTSPFPLPTPLSTATVVLSST